MATHQEQHEICEFVVFCRNERVAIIIVMSASQRNDDEEYIYIYLCYNNDIHNEIILSATMVNHEKQI